MSRRYSSDQTTQSSTQTPSKTTTTTSEKKYTLEEFDSPGSQNTPSKRSTTTQKKKLGSSTTTHSTPVDQKLSGRKLLTERPKNLSESKQKITQPYKRLTQVEIFQATENLLKESRNPLDYSHPKALIAVLETTITMVQILTLANNKVDFEKLDLVPKTAQWQDLSQSIRQNINAMYSPYTAISSKYQQSQIYSAIQHLLQTTKGFVETCLKSNRILQNRQNLTTKDLNLFIQHFLTEKVITSRGFPAYFKLNQIPDANQSPLSQYYNWLMMELIVQDLTLTMRSDISHGDKEEYKKLLVILEQTDNFPDTPKILEALVKELAPESWRGGVWGYSFPLCIQQFLKNGSSLTTSKYLRRILQLPVDPTELKKFNEIQTHRLTLDKIGKETTTKLAELDTQVEATLGHKVLSLSTNLIDTFKTLDRNLGRTASDPREKYVSPELFAQQLGNYYSKYHAVAIFGNYLPQEQEMEEEDESRFTHQQQYIEDDEQDEGDDSRTRKSKHKHQHTESRKQLPPRQDQRGYTGGDEDQNENDDLRRKSKPRQTQYEPRKQHTHQDQRQQLYTEDDQRMDYGHAPGTSSTAYEEEEGDSLTYQAYQPLLQSRFYSSTRSNQDQTTTLPSFVEREEDTSVTNQDHLKFKSPYGSIAGYTSQQPRTLSSGRGSYPTTTTTRQTIPHPLGGPGTFHELTSTDSRRTKEKIHGKKQTVADPLATSSTSKKHAATAPIVTKDSTLPTQQVNLPNVQAQPKADPTVTNTPTGQSLQPTPIPSTQPPTTSTETTDKNQPLEIKVAAKDSSTTLKTAPVTADNPVTENKKENTASASISASSSLTTSTTEQTSTPSLPSSPPSATPKTVPITDDSSVTEKKEENTASASIKASDSSTIDSNLTSKSTPPEKEEEEEEQDEEEQDEEEEEEEQEKVSTITTTNQTSSSSSSSTDPFENSPPLTPTHSSSPFTTKQGQSDDDKGYVGHDELTQTFNRGSSKTSVLDNSAIQNEDDEDTTLSLPTLHFGPLEKKEVTQKVQNPVTPQTQKLNTPPPQKTELFSLEDFESSSSSSSSSSSGSSHKATSSYTTVPLTSSKDSSSLPSPGNRSTPTQTISPTPIPKATTQALVQQTQRGGFIGRGNNANRGRGRGRGQGSHLSPSAPAYQPKNPGGRGGPGGRGRDGY